MKYKVILADPPWAFKTYSKKGLGRSAEAHYDCLSIEELCKLPIGDFGDEDCALLMWVTDPMLPKGLKVMEAWGFGFSTVAFYWAKLNASFPKIKLSMTEADFFTGMGYYARCSTEQCWLGTRKKKPKRLHKDVRKLVISPRQEHSRKPEEVYDRIERLFAGPYIEFFSRSTRPGWTSWGDQVGLFDQGSVKTRRFPSDLTDKP